MPNKGCRFIQDFFVQSTFFFSPHQIATTAATEHSHRGNVALPVVGSHTIEVENLTTLPYDVEIVSTAPDDDGFAFYFDNNADVTWTASFKSILNVRIGKSCVVVHPQNPVQPGRIQTMVLRLKRPIWIDWQEEAIYPVLELAIEAE
jgi:hypothetical protein